MGDNLGYWREDQHLLCWSLMGKGFTPMQFDSSKITWQVAPYFRQWSYSKPCDWFLWSEVANHNEIKIALICAISKAQLVWTRANTGAVILGDGEAAQGDCQLCWSAHEIEKCADWRKEQHSHPVSGQVRHKTSECYQLARHHHVAGLC